MGAMPVNHPPPLPAVEAEPDRLRRMVAFGLFGQDGRRKYLTLGERQDFLRAAEAFDPEVRTFAALLHYTGCRISEGLAESADRFDLGTQSVVFRSLKKREATIFRSVPVPPAFLDMVDLVHGIRRSQRRPDGGSGTHLWPWGRMTAWRRIKDVMSAAGIRGPHACPKGLRHGFGVAAVSAGIPLNMVQKWMGHADLATTAIYADAIGAEEQAIAARMW